MEKASIGVIIPIFNSEEWLQRCIDSVLRQTFRDYIIILIDDGSFDGSAAICDQYAGRYSCIHVIHKNNEGQAEARNNGLEYALSLAEWIVFVDSDDYLHVNCFELLYTAAVKSKLKLAMCNTARVPIAANVSEESTRAANDGFVVCNMMEFYGEIIENKTYLVGVWAKLFHHSCFSRLRFPTGRLWEDLAVFYKILFVGEGPEGGISECAWLSEELYYYSQNENSTIHKSWTPKNFDELAAYEEQLAFFKTYNKDLYRKTARRYIKAINYQYDKIRNSSLEERQKDRYVSVIRKKMRRAILKYGLLAGVRYPEYSWELEIAFPRGMQGYWILQSQTEKMKKRIKRGK